MKNLKISFAVENQSGLSFIEKNHWSVYSHGTMVKIKNEM